MQSINQIKSILFESMTGFLFGEPHFSVALSFRGSRSSRRG